MQSELYNLQGRRALVTGASRGIGRAIAIALARHGASVAVHYSSREDHAEQVVEEAVALGAKAFAVRADLSDPDAPRPLFDAASARLGGVDILVLNASVQHRVAWPEITPEQLDEQVNINFRASFLLMQFALPAMQQRKWGRILTVGSVQQVKPHPMMPIYAATKCAQLSLVRTLAKEVAADGITINNLAPGVIETDRNADVLQDPQRRSKVVGMIPVGFMGQPEDCVPTALLLCSDAGRYITGSDFLVDGGWSL